MRRSLSPLVNWISTVIGKVILSLDSSLWPGSISHLMDYTGKSPSFFKGRRNLCSRYGASFRSREPNGYVTMAERHRVGRTFSIIFIVIATFLPWITRIPIVMRNARREIELNSYASEFLLPRNYDRIGYK